MSEKVLKGFYEEDAEKDTEFYRGIKYSPAHIIEISKQVPVRLASESVDLKKLKEWCKRNMAAKFTDEDGNCWEDIVYIEDLIEWTEKEAKKK